MVNGSGCLGIDDGDGGVMGMGMERLRVWVTILCRRRSRELSSLLAP